MLEELKNRDFWLSADNQREFVKSLFKFLPFTVTISAVIFIASYFSLWKYFFPDGPIEIISMFSSLTLLLK